MCVWCRTCTKHSAVAMSRRCLVPSTRTSSGARPREIPTSPSGKAWVGADAILQNLFIKLGADWDGFTVHPKDFHDAVGTVVVEGRYTGTHKRTGKVLDAQVCHVWKIRDGKLTSFQQFVDTARLQDVTGA